MRNLSRLCAVSLLLLGCGLFGDEAPQKPPTAASFSPTVSFPSGLDCSNAGAGPISVSWDVKPIMLDSGTGGTRVEISTQEILNNSAGTPTDCYYTPSSFVSAASATGLQPGLWQITLTHSIFGYPNPIVCTRKLALGSNPIQFVIRPQIAGCQ